MVTANSSITSFFSMLGAVATASPKWEEISTASSSSPFGSKGFGALMGKELAKGSHLPKGKGGPGPPSGRFGKSGAFGVSGLGMLRRLEELDAGQMVAVGGELQVLFHTLQAMDTAKTPDELVDALAKLLSPEVFSQMQSETSPPSGVQGGEAQQEDLLSALLSMMSGAETSEASTSGGPSEEQMGASTQTGPQRASPAQQLAKLLAEILSQAQSTNLPQAGEEPATALNELEQLLARILDSHSQGQKGGESTAEALSKMVFFAGTEEEQPGQSTVDAQEVHDAKVALFEHRQAVVKRLALLIGKALQEGNLRQKARDGENPLPVGQSSQSSPVDLEKLIDLLQEGGTSQEAPKATANLAEFLEQLVGEIKAQPEVENSGENAPGPEVSQQPTGNETLSLADILKDLVGEMGDKAKEAKPAQSPQGSGELKPADSLSKVIQQLIAGDTHNRDAKGDGEHHFSWKNTAQDSFWHKGKGGGEQVSNHALFSHALGKTLADSPHATQSTLPLDGVDHAEKVAQAIMDTVKQVDMVKMGESHQMSIRMTLDGIHDLDISLTLSGQKEIALSFVADNTQVLHHLNSHAESLKAALQFHDIKVVSLSFNHPETGNHDYQQSQGGFGFHSFTQGSGQQTGNGGEFSGFFSSGAEAAGSGPAEAAPVPPSWGMDGLNIKA